ncbi:unnamed protein product [Aphanomyces euteiches]|nr:hypothetical protein AeRB84_020604 [Aphanomyces euteiches]
MRLALLVAFLLHFVAGQDILPEDDVVDAAECANRTAGYFTALTPGKFASSAFFDCFRPLDAVISFLDAFATANLPNVSVQKFNISTTVLGQSIPAYKLTSLTNTSKKAIYLQSTMHAREWISLTSTVFTWASLLDGIAAANSSIVKLVDLYDWVYVPIVNVDGYVYSWTHERFFRKNLRMRSYFPLNPESNFSAGVDLNRNFGPSFDMNEDSETYSGPEPFSEPEVKGIKSWIDKTQVNGPGLAGVLDIHSIGTYVLTPYANSSMPPVAPYGQALQTLAISIQSAVRSVAGGNYTVMSMYDMYFAQGTFSDYVFATYKVPSIVIEIEGNSFRVPSSTIRRRGNEITAAVLALANGIPQWNKEIQPPIAAAACGLRRPTTLLATLWLFAVLF